MLPEILKPIPSAPGYAVSNTGNVYSLARTVRRGSSSYHVSHRQLKTNRLKSGHLYVSIRSPLKTRTTSVHSLVLEVFAGPAPEGHQARHLNGNPDDNRWPENLEWATKDRNEQDKKWHSLPKGRKISAAAARKIKRALLNPQPGLIASLAKRFGVTITTIHHIKNGHTHKDVHI